MGEKHRKPCRQRKEAASQVKHRGLRRIYVFFLTLFVLAAVFMGMTAAEYNTRKIGFENDENTNHYLQDVVQQIVTFTVQWLD